LVFLKDKKREEAKKSKKKYPGGKDD